MSVSNTKAVNWLVIINKRNRNNENVHTRNTFCESLMKIAKSTQVQIAKLGLEYILLPHRYTLYDKFVVHFPEKIGNLTHSLKLKLKYKKLIRVVVFFKNFFSFKHINDPAYYMDVYYNLLQLYIYIIMRNHCYNIIFVIMLYANKFYYTIGFLYNSFRQKISLQYKLFNYRFQEFWLLNIQPTILYRLYLFY